MTEIQMRPRAVIEGPVDTHRYGSVGFRLSDPLAPSACRRAATELLTTFGLTWVPELVEDVETMVTELVTNACEHGGTAFPAGSLTLWHPNRWLVIAVHDKNPKTPWQALRQARQGMSLEAAGYFEDGRGLAIVHGLAQRHCGELSFDRDYDKACPGKVATVKMLLPNVQWRNTFTDPWTGRVIVGNAR